VFQRDRPLFTLGDLCDLSLARTPAGSKVERTRKKKKKKKDSCALVRAAAGTVNTRGRTHTRTHTHTHTHTLCVRGQRVERDAANAPAGVYMLMRLKGRRLKVTEGHAANRHRTHTRAHVGFSPTSSGGGSADPTAVAPRGGRRPAGRGRGSDTRPHWPPAGSPAPLCSPTHGAHSWPEPCRVVLTHTHTHTHTHTQFWSHRMQHHVPPPPPTLSQRRADAVQ